MSDLDLYRRGREIAGSHPRRLPSPSEPEPAFVRYTTRRDYGEWETLPRAIRCRVQPHLHGDELVGYVEPPATLPRGATYWQTRKAWWGSSLLLAVVQARRPVALAERRAKPAARWEGQVRLYRLAPAPIRAQIWALKDAPGAVSMLTQPRETNVPTDLLPPKLRAPVAGGRCGSLLSGRGGAVTELVMAYRTGQGSVALLRAQRQAGSEAALPGQPWESRVLETSIIGVTTVSLSDTARGPGWPSGGWLMPQRMTGGGRRNGL